MRGIKSLLFILTAFAFASCTQRITDFTLMSSKNFDITRLSEYKKLDKRVSADSRLTTIIIIQITATSQPTIKEALDKAIESIPGCIGLIDGVVYSGGLFTGLYNTVYYEIEGTPIIDPKWTAIDTPNSNINKLNLDENGNILSTESLTFADYAKITKNINREVVSEKLY